jgi:aspartyl-tRNA(Asn)/glutamyl-tRNA(Gln) amidotransferase subunit A
VILDFTVTGIARAIAAGRLSAAEACDETLSRIAAAARPLGAFLHVQEEEARARAREVDETPREKRGPLAGVPIAVKDNLCMRGVPTTAGSRVLEGHVAVYDATVVSRLVEAGAVIVGKTNCDEFAMGSSTENSGYFPARNPWATDRIPGGSSGGSAVAVAARLVPGALGSDTGGSIRQPAAMCGVVGLKTTYGRVSRYGLIAFASSLDQVGPITTTVEDAATLLGIIAGHDPADSSSAQVPVADYSAKLTRDVRGTKLGVPRALLEEGTEPAVAVAFEAALEVLAARGAVIETIDLPHARYAIPVYYLVATAEASSNLARYDGVRYGRRAPLDAAAESPLIDMYERTRASGFGAEVKRRIMLGTYALSAGYYDAFYLKAQKVRTLITRDYEQALERVDAIAMPTSPTTAFRLGERIDDPLQMYLADVLTVGPSLAGLPALNVPCGFSPDRLPVGLQLVGRAFDEAALLAIGEAYERETNWHREVPEIARSSSRTSPGRTLRS